MMTLLTRVLMAPLSWLPDQFQGGAMGVLAALVSTVVIIIGAIFLDRRFDGWLQSWTRPKTRLHRLATEHAAMLRVSIWTLSLVLALSLAAELSPPVAWMLLPAGGLALALAVSDLMRDALVGIGQALSARVKRGDHVSVGDLAGEVERVGIRSIRLRTLDGTIVDIPQRRIMTEGIQRLQVEGGGYPVSLDLPIPTEIPIHEAMEEARLAALLAKHAHLGKGATAAVTDGEPARIRVVGHAIDAFHGSQYRGQVVALYHAALHALQDKHGP